MSKYLSGSKIILNSIRPQPQNVGRPFYRGELTRVDEEELKFLAKELPKKDGKDGCTNTAN
jgi:hypothetical protein